MNQSIVVFWVFNNLYSKLYSGISNSADPDQRPPTIRLNSHTIINGIDEEQKESILNMPFSFNYSSYITFQFRILVSEIFHVIM